MLIDKLCVVGERVSGTCFVQKLITENTKLKSVSPFNHKHYFQNTDLIRKTDTSRILFVFISRDIIEWLNSFLNNTFHADRPIRNCKDMDVFIRMEWKCIFDKTSGTPETDKSFGREMMCERNPVDGKRFSNVIQMRNSKMEHFLELENIVENYVHLRYEEVRDSPEEFLSGITTLFGIPKNKTFKPISTVRGKGKYLYERKMYPEMKENDVDFVIQNLNMELEDKLGYLSS